jgi:lysozyme
MKLPDKNKVLDVLVRFLARPENENIVLVPYKDQKGIWTIGIGITHYENGAPVTEHDPHITLARAYELTKKYSEGDYNWLASKVSITLGVNQTAAIMSLLYNIGRAGFANSTVLRRLNMGDFSGAADAFLMWDKVTMPSGEKVESTGLLNRRKREVKLFKTGDENVAMV